ncbi:MAG: FGGY-family carbohydrate kinase [Kiritimatiellales bacterium]
MSLLGIDLGTTGCKAGVFARNGDCIAQAYREYDMLHPQPGWSELDSRLVWSKTREVIAEVAAPAKHDPITALSVSAFGEAFVPVSKNRELLDNSILCVDDRGVEHVKRMVAAFGREALYRINPNLLGPNYSMPKLLWLRENRPEIFQNADYFLLWSDLTAFLLGCDPVTNNSHANRTLLFDLKKNDWSDVLLKWSGIPREKLGRVVSGGDIIGTVSDAMAEKLGLPKGVQVVAGGHDQCCNALGCGAVSAGKAVYGLGSFDCITPVYSKPSGTLEMLRENLNIEHHVLPGLYVSFLYNQSGLLVKWFRDTFASGAGSYEQLDSEMPVPPTRLLVLPHFDTPPHHSPDTAGVIAGLRTDTKRGEILKAIIEGATCYFVEGIQSLHTLGIDTAAFIASGGGARSDAGLQIRADIFGIPIIRPRITEAGLLGAAILAGISTGVFASAGEAVELFVHEERMFEPDAARHEFYRQKVQLYRQLYSANRALLGGLQAL